MEIKEIVNNVNIYGLRESIRASKYPMSVETNLLNNYITDTTCKLGSAKGGFGHDNFLKGIVVQFDLTMTNKMSVEMERYHFIDFVSSQSTMHRITKFDLDTSYIDYVDKRIINIMKSKIKEYNNLSNEEEKKQKYLEILYSNPCGFKLTARMTTNYQQLKTIYYQRKNHRLPEWVIFCKWIETLPYFKEICLGEINKNETSE